MEQCLVAWCTVAAKKDAVWFCIEMHGRQLLEEIKASDA